MLFLGFFLFGTKQLDLPKFTTPFSIIIVIIVNKKKINLPNWILTRNCNIFVLVPWKNKVITMKGRKKSKNIRFFITFPRLSVSNYIIHDNHYRYLYVATCIFNSFFPFHTKLSNFVFFFFWLELFRATSFPFEVTLLNEK